MFSAIPNVKCKMTLYIWNCCIVLILNWTAYKVGFILELSEGGSNCIVKKLF